MQEIIVIRHGETDWNAEGRLQGTLDTDLNEKGIQQAREAALLLRGRGIEVVYASPLLRARKTAEIISGVLGVPLVFREGLKEKHFGVMQGLRVSEIGERYGNLLWDLRAMLELAPPEGESNQDVLRRVVPVLEEVDALPERRVLLVTHGAVARMLYKVLAQPEEDRFATFQMKNCQILSFSGTLRDGFSCRDLTLTSTEPYSE